MQWLIGLIAGTGGPIGWIANLILNFFWGKVTDAIAKDVAQKKSEQAIDDQKAAAVKEENEAHTKAELDAADDDLMRQL